MLNRKVLVTAALPYANARPHLGHLRSTYLPADIYSRYNRMIGNNTLYICASDEHGTPIEVRAGRESTTPKQIVDSYHEMIRSDLERMSCSFDFFGRTTYPSHYSLTQEFFTSLLNKGYIYKTSYEQLYCDRDLRFLPDRYVEGTCPFCGAVGARGDSCEACGRYLKPTELVEPHCTICGETPSVKSTDHWFFRLSSFQKFLAEWIKNNRRLPDNVRNYALQWIKDGLRDWCITRDLSWGVPVPMENAQGKVLYVWFDAPIGYVSSTFEWAKRYSNEKSWFDYWKNEETDIVHFIGKDIIYHHSIFWPAMLKGKGDYNLPAAIVAGEYLTLEGKKMSKSREWLVGIDDYLKSFRPDPLRYYLIVVAPMDRDADFSWREFARRNNDELADILGNFVHRSLSFTYRFFDKKIPESQSNGEDDKDIVSKILETKRQIDIAMEIFDFKAAMQAVFELAAEGNRYLNEKEPWKTIRQDRREAASILSATSRIVKALAFYLAPLLPNAAQEIWEALGQAGSIHCRKWDESIEPIRPGTDINEPKPLFMKIDEDIVRLLVERLHDRDEEKILETA